MIVVLPTPPLPLIAIFIVRTLSISDHVVRLSPF